MRKVVAYELISLDGVAEDPDRFITEWDPVMDANLARVISSQDAVILGRRSYDEWSRFWPNSEIEPFASFINNVPKFVATSTDFTLPWSNSTKIEGELSTYVRGLQQKTGGDIGVHASIQVVQSLLRAGLVDELRLVVAPAIEAQGRRLLDGVPQGRWHTRQSSVSPTGHLLVDYVRDGG